MITPRRLAFSLIALLIATAGCSSMSSSDGSGISAAQHDCERQGGVWNVATGNCIPNKPK